MTKPSNAPNLVPKHRQLVIFMGHWQVEGKAYGEGQNAQYSYRSAVKWTSQESYEWLEGGYFLIQCWDALVKPFRGRGLTGFLCVIERRFESQTLKSIVQKSLLNQEVRSESNG